MTDSADVLAVTSQLALIVFPIFLGLLAWTGKRLYDRFDELERRLATVDKTTAVMQIEITHLAKDMTELKAQMNNIEKKVDGRP